MALDLLLEVLSTKDCLAYLTDWVKKNPNALKKDSYALSLVAGGKHPWVSDGTKPKDWKRVGKRKVGDEIVRLFMPSVTIYATDNIVAVIEKDGKPVRLEHGTPEAIYQRYGMRPQYGF